MSQVVYVEAVYPEEVRVVVRNAEKIEEYTCELSRKKHLKGNIYLAKIVKIEPGLQAAFVEYLKDEDARQGFLPFSEVDPEYYQIPTADRKKLLDSVNKEGSEKEDLARDEDVEEILVHRKKNAQCLYKKYQIQEVLKAGQLLLVQVVKEERGNKGATLTTYITLPGQYTILMPNSGGKSSGISRKIVDRNERRRLRDCIKKLQLPVGKSIILRTVVIKKPFKVIQQDCNQLIKLWNSIREKTLVSEAPILIQEEGNILIRILRDLDINNITKIIIDGEEFYRETLRFVEALELEYKNKIFLHKLKVPIFIKYNIEEQIDNFHKHEVSLGSGGYIVINVTEALIAIDVNSGRFTDERNIEETALKTNVEAAREIVKQLKLRDLSGLIVVDFIDMSSLSNCREVESVLKNELQYDRAKIQIGRISTFGLLELSRQRLRPNFFDTHYSICNKCGGSGYMKSIAYQSIIILRMIENYATKRKVKNLELVCNSEVLTYLVNYKKNNLKKLEAFYNINIVFQLDDHLDYNSYKLNILKDHDTTLQTYLANDKWKKIAYENPLSIYKKTEREKHIKKTSWVKRFVKMFKK